MHFLGLIGGGDGCGVFGGVEGGDGVPSSDGTCDGAQDGYGVFFTVSDPDGSLSKRDKKNGDEFGQMV